MSKTMNRRLIKLLIIALLCGSATAFGQASSTEARLIRLEEGQKSLDKRFDDLNTRLGDLRSEMNTRFTELREDVNTRFDTMEFWFQLVMGTLVLIIGGLVSQWLFLWRRVIQIETVVDKHLKETEKDVLLGFYRKELEELKQEVNKLKAKVAA
jgi:cell division protein FtsB